MATRLFMIARFANNLLRISRRVSQKDTFLKPQIRLNTPANVSGKLQDIVNVNLTAACLHFTKPNALTNKILRSLLHQVSKRRLNTNENETPSYPLLMDFPPKCTFNIFLGLRNFINAYLVIRPAFDKDFTVPRFIEGAKQAIILVSEILADGEVEKLRGLVTQEAIEEIEKNLPRFSEAQRRDLAINPTHINYIFAYEVGIIMEDDGRRFVEITVVVWVNPVLEDVKQSFLRSQNVPSFQEFMELSEKASTICNYRFIREYTKGVESSWVINALNHYKAQHIDKALKPPGL